RLIFLCPNLSASERFKMFEDLLIDFNSQKAKKEYRRLLFKVVLRHSLIFLGNWIFVLFKNQKVLKAVLP
ncbi:hypothetical protein REC12_00380, partial [Desulfosporosinus sp. PR]|uniref:hypothetical protein n=1 Tax=Candidatus Desulfosporosinus nitrosoreducens TaxID=3401928 RepID=UPI0027F0239D